MRRLFALLALLLLTGAAPPAPPPPPAMGVTVTPVSGARRTDAVLPGLLLDTVLIRSAEGRRRYIALTSPDDPKATSVPEGPRSLYQIDPERPGAPRRLLDGLPAKINALAAADLDGDGAEEILVGEPGKLWTVGSPDTPAAPRLLLETSGFDLQRWDSDMPGLFQAAEAGRLRTWRLDGGRLVSGPEHSLPVRVDREQNALLLWSLAATAIPGPDGEPLQVAGPENNGKLRLRTILLGPDGQRSEAWSRLPGREDVDSFRYVALDGRPALIVLTSDAEKIGIFAKQRFRLFPLTVDRSRSGQPPSLAFETETNRWFPVDPVLRDLDKDGKQDLVVIQPEGLGGGDLVIDTFFGQGDGRFERPRRQKLSNLEARSWSYDRDVTGDGIADLVAVANKGLRIFLGTSDPRKELLDRRSRPAIALGGERETVTVALGVGNQGANLLSSRSGGFGSPYLEDLDGDGRAEVLVASNTGGRGRVTVVRLGG